MIEVSAWAALVAAPLIAALSAILVAWINKRREKTDPLDRAVKLIDQLQEDRQDDKQLRIDMRAKLDSYGAKIDKLYDLVGEWRDYGTKWELWHADGMPDPPGRPQRPTVSD